MDSLGPNVFRVMCLLLLEAREPRLSPVFGLGLREAALAAFSAFSVLQSFEFVPENHLDQMSSSHPQ